MTRRGVPLVVLLLRVGIGALFIVAGASKIGHAAQFAQQIAAFRLVPQVLVAPMAVMMPFVEVLLGTSLVLGLFTRAAAWAAVALLAVFDAAIASAVVRGMSLDCGCFGPNDATLTSWSEVARDAVLIAVALVVALRPPGTLALDRRMERAS